MSKVVLVRGKDSEAMVDKDLTELRIDQHRENVVIKPNLLINRPPPVTPPVDAVVAIKKSCQLLPLVGKGGLEPPRLSAPDPKSGPSANSGTPPQCKL